MDEEAERTLTDWSRLRRLTDAEIEAALAADPDSYAVDQSEEVGRKGASFHYRIYSDSNKVWRWQLLSAQGDVIAVGGQGYESRRAVQDDLVRLRDVLLGAKSKAA